jgi:hypothetical protein
MFVDHLCKGHTILITTVSGKTIEKYLIGAVDYCIEHGSSRRDPSMDLTSGQRLDTIAKIIQDAKRWDKMIKRQEPLTKAMVAHLEEQTAKQESINSHDRALVDWAKTGLATGYRGVEWCQYKEPKTAANIHRATDPQRTIYAVTAENVVFKDNRNRPIFSPPEAIPLRTMGGVEIKWDIQKNGNHGEHRLFTADQSFPQFCTAKASVTRAFKALAMSYYGLPKGDVRLKYTPQSLRVGACVILHTQGLTEPQIQNILR